MRCETASVEDVVITQGTRSVPVAYTHLQMRLDTFTKRACYLNFHFAPHKSELKHMIPTMHKLNPNIPTNSVSHYEAKVTRGESIKS